MGARGPKRGHKTLAAVAAQKAAAVAVPAPAVHPPKAVRAPRAPAEPVQRVVSSIEEASKLSAAHRENPAKLGGDALRQLGQRRGLARSDMARMSDDKIREQLRYLTHRQYAEES